MKVVAAKFGAIEIEQDDLLFFPEGLMGFENCLHWAILNDAFSDHVAWLQSVEEPETALAVISPRRFVPEYKIHVSRMELLPLRLENPNRAEALAVLGKSERGLHVNLKAPLLINPDRRLGRQVITSGDYPLQYDLGRASKLWKKIA